LFRVGDHEALDLGEGSQPGGGRLARTHDVVNVQTTDHKRIGDKRAVAPPRHGFRAHDDHVGISGEVDELTQRCPELHGLHVVGEAAKRQVAPADIRGLPGRMAQAPEPGQVPVRDACGRQRLAQDVDAVLRVVTGPRDSTDVGEQGDVVLLQEVDERAERTDGVPDRPQCRAWSVDDRGSGLRRLLSHARNPFCPGAEELPAEPRDGAGSRARTHRPSTVRKATIGG